MGISPIVIPLLNSKHKVVGIIECAPRARVENCKENPAYRFASRIYSRLRRKLFSLKDLCLEKQIPYYYMDKRSDSALEGWVKACKPDLIVIFSMSQLLKKNIFSIPRYGTINLHPSILPKYRGPNPWFWMYYDNDLHPGVTVHFIDEGEDTGDIIYQEGFDISLGTPYQEVYKKAIVEVGTRLLLQALDDIGTGYAPRHPQTKEIPNRRARHVSPDECRSLIDFDRWPIQRIWHFLRAEAHWAILPEIKGLNKGYKWVIGDYETCTMNKVYTPGRIYRERGRYFLACRDGKINLQIRFSVKRFIAHLFLR